MPMQTVGIIAGSGQFPALVAEGARAQGCRVIICGFTGNTDPALASLADAFTMLHLGQLGALIQFFKKHQITHICMAGAISKPKALDIRPDFRAAKLLFSLATRKGDDAILRAFAGELQQEGFTVIRPETLAPRLKSPEGLLTRAAPSAELWQDIAFGWHIAKEIGRLDIGQCVVVKSGIVVAVEGIEGTNPTIDRAAALAGAGCTLVKVAKPGQDERLDLPSVGLETVKLLARHKFLALAYEAEKTLFFDLDQSIAAANTHKLALVGIPEASALFFQGHDKQ